MVDVIASKATSYSKSKQSPRNDSDKVFDIAIIGAGAVGSAIARELSRYELNIALIDSNPDVGMGTSKASTAIWHTGFDAKPGSLEATLMRRSYRLMEKFLPEANVAHERLGAILIAWNEEQFNALPDLLKKAHENGVIDVQIISADEIYRREPKINKGALGGLFVQGEGILCTFTVPLACATQAVLNGAQLFLNHRVKNAAESNDGWILSCESDEIRARFIVNAAGLFSDEINNLFGHSQFKVTPRRGQLIIYDKLARPLVNHVLLPVPTSKTKGVLISPTVYGNILLGPTAEDLDDKSGTQTTADGLNMLIEKGRAILPQLLDEEVTATYSGLRAATEHSDYQIEMNAAQRYLCVGGIRSTGISASLGIAEYAAELLCGAGLELKLKNDFKFVKMPSIGQAQMRPHQNAEMIASDPSYAEMVCHCERVSRGELRDALNAPIPASTLDGLRRRTRASQGRCQGFNCHAALLSALRGGLSSREAAYRNPTTLAPSASAGERSSVEPGIASLGLDTSEKNTRFTRLALAMTYEVLIVGAGPAGLSAAIELKKQGIRDVLVVDREPEAGGMPRFCHHTGFGREDLWRMYSGPRYARYYRELAEKHDVEIQTSTTITSWSDALQMDFTSPRGLGKIKAQSILLATGVRERPRSARLIPGTRPQGIYTTGSLQRFVYQEHLPVGKRAVIVGAELVSLSALLTLMEANVKCAMMITEQARHQIEFPFITMKWLIADVLTRTPTMTQARITNIFGYQRVEGIELTHATGQTEMVECDTVIFTGNWIPEYELARLGGLELNPVTRGPKIDSGFRSSVNGVFVAGNLLRGVETADHCAIEGKHAARSIVQFLKQSRG
ncbi:MAG TPA: FAD-dependent oxidoreductase [Anaerolineales bacterium]